MTDTKRISIEVVRTGELLDFINRPGVLQGHVIPISRLRAAAHANNPCAAPNDPALVLAMRDGECLGYIGYMPGLLRIDDQLHKIFWGSTWYAAKGSSAGGVLQLAAVRLLDADLAATGLAPKTFEIYRRLGYKSIDPLPYFELSFDKLDPLGFPWRVLQVLLRRRERRSSAVDALLCACRAPAKLVAYGIAKTAIANLTRDYEFVELSELPSDAWSDEVPRQVEFVRTVEMVRWALQYPWITDRRECSTPGYEFSDFRDLVRFVVLECRHRESNHVLGHVVLSICRDQAITTVKVLDHFLHSDDRYRILLAAALVYSQRFKADRIHVPDGCGGAISKSALLRFTFRRRSRVYFCYPRRRSSILGPVLEHVKLQFCDGDTPFS